MFDPSFVPGRWYYFKSCDVAELTDEIIDITMERSLQIKSPLTSFPIWQGWGGRASRRRRDRVQRPQSCLRTTSVVPPRRARASTRSASGFGASGRLWSRGTRACRTSSVTRGPSRLTSLRAGEVRTAAIPEAEVRPGELLPDQPEHRAELALAQNRSHRASVLTDVRSTVALVLAVAALSPQCDGLRRGRLIVE